MDLKSFYSPLSLEAREEFAKRCDSTRGVIQNVMYGVRPCATDLAVAIERESGKAVTRWELRPDDWFKHWPELIGSAGAPRVPAGKIVAGKPGPDLAHGAASTSPHPSPRKGDQHPPHDKPTSS